VTIKRKKVRKEIDKRILPEHYLDIEFFSGPIDDVVSRIASLNKAVKELGYEDARIEIIYRWDDVELEVEGTRWETDKELQKRQRASEAAKKSAEARKIKQREAKKALYEKLKKEFG